MLFMFLVFFMTVMIVLYDSYVSSFSLARLAPLLAPGDGDGEISRVFLQVVELHELPLYYHYNH